MGVIAVGERFDSIVTEFDVHDVLPLELGISHRHLVGATETGAKPIFQLSLRCLA